MSALINLRLLRQINSKFGLIRGSYLQVQNISTRSQYKRVVLSDDGSTVVCWHPEQPFPFEYSKPIPEEANQETNSVLKVQNVSEIYDVFKPKSEEQTREELMRITSTSKHVWFPRGKKTYKKKPVPRDRKYL
uniref:Large ribosomal subunit protein mL42 n=1 Tax=Graphocephala atropunctata TaxID=36148 RepID=A0A1B6K9T3_9HEMI